MNCAWEGSKVESSVVLFGMYRVKIQICLLYEGRAGGLSELRKGDRARRRKESLGQWQGAMGARCWLTGTHRADRKTAAAKEARDQTRRQQGLTPAHTIEHATMVRSGQCAFR